MSESTDRVYYYDGMVETDVTDQQVYEAIKSAGKAGVPFHELMERFGFTEVYDLAYITQRLWLAGLVYEMGPPSCRRVRSANRPRP